METEAIGEPLSLRKPDDLELVRNGFRVILRPKRVARTSDPENSLARALVEVKGPENTEGHVQGTIAPKQLSGILLAGVHLIVKQDIELDRAVGGRRAGHRSDRRAGRRGIPETVVQAPALRAETGARGGQRHVGRHGRV